MIARLNFPTRYVQGTVENVTDTALWIRLSESRNGIDTAKVNRAHWPEAHPPWTKGMAIQRLFLYDLSASAKSGGSGHWFGSLVWLDPETNPWEEAHRFYPRPLDEVHGEVINHTNHQSAIVRLADSGIEADLPLSNVPDGFYGMDESFPIGLKVRALITEVEDKRCEVLLSVIALLKQYRDAQGDAPHSEGERHDITRFLRFTYHAPLLPKVADTDTAAPSWEQYRICIVDDDRDFCRQLAAWFKQFGAKVWAVQNANQLMALLKKDDVVISHFLVDHGLGTATEREHIMKIIRDARKKCPVSIISGIPEEGAVDYAKELGLAFFAKPITYSMMHLWLTEGTAPTWRPQEREPASYWEPGGGAYRPQLQVEAANWLAAVCRVARAPTALWVRCYHPGYSLVAYHGVVDVNREKFFSQMVNQLQQTIVHDVEQSGKRQIQEQVVGVFTPIWARGMYLNAEPLQSFELSGGVVDVDDVLLVFAPSPFVLDDPGCEKTLRQWWQSLARLEQTETRLEEEAPFATQGRVHSATLHELRPLMQAFDRNTRWSEEIALRWWESGKKARQLIDSSLYNIRPDRNQRLNVHERIHTVMATFLWQLIERREVSVLVHLPSSDLELNLPPEVLEQPLINMIDNATKFCKDRKWARVEVRVFAEEDMQFPLVIEVRDQGVGMTPKEERYLFRPRHTSSGHKGFGMGLYVSRSLAKAVGGDLVLKSNFRWVGCCFQLRLPLKWQPN